MSGGEGRTISALDVAGYIVAHCRTSPTHKKVQKLVYYAQGFTLAIRGCPLFGEAIQAWDNGPVVRRIYHEYRDLPNPIPRPASFESSRILPEDRELLDAILGTYGMISGGRLGGMTHSEPPWREAYNVCRNTPLSIPTMKSFFSELVELSKSGRSIPNHPFFPVSSLQHQRRRELSDRMDRHREKLRAIASRPRVGIDPWINGED